MKNKFKNTNIVEIFSSVQGEGPYIGLRQLFIRFTDCNLSCNYCDTVFIPQKYCKVEIPPGSGLFKEILNPITTEQLINTVKELTYFNCHSISLTGGEPLLNSEYIKEFLKELSKKQAHKIYLETNGTLPQELDKLIDLIDIISMDFKLESSCKTKTPWEKHKEFIKVAQDNNKEIFAKIVISKHLTDQEITEIIDTVKSLKTEIPIILQPLTSNDLSLLPDSKFLMNVQEALLTKLKEVRIIPQVHKYLNFI